MNSGMKEKAADRRGISPFLDLNKEAVSDNSAPYAVLPIPYERTVSFGKGTKQGPAAILSASREIDNFDEELKTPVDIPVQTLPLLQLDEFSPEKAVGEIHDKSLDVLEAKRFLLSLGGEHTISVGAILAAAEVYPDLGVLHIDAHLDLRESYGGTRFSHACVMRRVLEKGIPAVHVGIRSCSTEEYTFSSHQGCPIFWAPDLARNGPDECKTLLLSLLPDTVYISMDIDGLDPSLVPGTGTPEPGGLDWFSLLSILRHTVTKKNVVAADVVEVAPIPGSHVSEFVAARLATKILLYHACRNTLLHGDKGSAK